MAYLALQQEWHTPGHLPSSFFSSVVSHLHDALSTPTSDLARVLENELSQVISRVLKHADPQAMAVGQGRVNSGALADAYAMGQLSMAQQLASQAAHAGVDQDFLDAFKTGKFIPFLNALFDAELNNKELKAIVGQTEENVSRRMKELRALGISDFRKDGTLVYNFLTPVARQIMSAQREVVDEVMAELYQDFQPGVGAVLECMARQSPDHMRKAATFERHAVAHELVTPE